MDLDVEALRAKLAALSLEHRDLDDVIARLAERMPFDQLQLQRLKKRKLALRRTRFRRSKASSCPTSSRSAGPRASRPPQPALLTRFWVYIALSAASIATWASSFPVNE